MSSYRLDNSGCRIDRSHHLSFTFDGRAYSGFKGDTLASALLASGVTVVGRSFKYHRPRGIFSAGVEEPNALVTLRKGNRSEPNIRATEIELYDGLEATSQNCWPSPKFDLMAVNQLAGNAFAAGFYYKTFMGPKAAFNKTTELWWQFEKFIRRAAGLGKASIEADPDCYERMNAWCDVLVAGSGPAGLAAVEASIAAGANV
ncbi:MAG: sarcosine oxidase subunit alpha family protein, partial [Rhodobacteraceae bacterium]|nr:sarcosine oxidase subunit alpha family protein [Paracoccaceae bacterium]